MENNVIFETDVIVSMIIAFGFGLLLIGGSILQFALFASRMVL